MKKRSNFESDIRHRFSLLVNWSPEDKAFIVCVPELGHDAKTHGATLEKAIEMAKDLIATHVDFREQRGEPVPDALYFDSRTNFAPDAFAELPGLRGETGRFRRWSDEQTPRRKRPSKMRITA